MSHGRVDLTLSPNDNAWKRDKTTGDFTGLLIDSFIESLIYSLGIFEARTSNRIGFSRQTIWSILKRRRGGSVVTKKLRKIGKSRENPT